MSDPIEEEIDDAICSGNLDSVREIFTLHPQYIHRKWRGFKPWLSIAATSSGPEMLRLLVDLGCDVNDPRTDIHFLEYPLHNAITFDQVDNVRFLLDHGASTDIDRVVISAVVGFKENALEMVKLLAEYGADLNKVYLNETSGEPMNALSTAVAWGKEEIAEFLRSKGCFMPQTSSKDTEMFHRESLQDEIVVYFGKHFGPVSPQSVFEIVPTEPRIVVRVIPAGPGRNHVTLFTTGMSAQAMRVEPGEEDFQYGELFIQLSADWNFQDLHDPSRGWPLEWLRTIAQYSSRNPDWTSGPLAVISNGEPPQPLATGIHFTGLLMMAEKQMISREGTTIHLYRLTPLYPEEVELEHREGVIALIRAFDRESVPMVVDLNRPNVAIDD